MFYYTTGKTHIIHVLLDRYKFAFKGRYRYTLYRFELRINSDGSRVVS